MSRVELALELRGCAKTYRSGSHLVRALKPTDLALRGGDYLAVMGPSGSGKSTLLNILGLLRRPSEGQVLIAGCQTQQLSDRELSALRGATLGFVFQEYHLLAQRTALENVELPLIYGRVPRRARRIQAMEALERVGVARRAYGLPSELSGGERQRVAIARSTIRGPRVLLCDEPTGNLDSESAERIMALLGELNLAGVTVIVVTHDPSVAAQARRLLTIRDGVASEEVGA